LYLILALVFALVVAVFAVQNTMTVSINFATWTFDTPLVIVILGAAALGALSVGVLWLFNKIGMSFRLWDAQAQMRRLQGEVKRLKEKVKELEGLNEKLERAVGEGNREAERATLERPEAGQEEPAGGIPSEGSAPSAGGEGAERSG